MSVTHGQCDARPTVTFPVTRHHRPLAGTTLYCLVREVPYTCVNNFPRAEDPTCKNRALAIFKRSLEDLWQNKPDLE